MPQHEQMTPFVVEVRPARHHFPFSATINNLSRVTFPEEIIMKLRLVSPLAAALGLAWTSSVLLLLASPTTDAAKISKFGHLHKRRAGSFEKDGVRDGRYAVNDHDFRGRRLNIFEHCPTVKTAKSSKSTTPTLCQCVACCEGMSILQTFVGIIYRERWRDNMISFFHLQDMCRLVYLFVRVCFRHKNLFGSDF